jgi:hypothetical protein
MRFDVVRVYLTLTLSYAPTMCDCVDLQQQYLTLTTASIYNTQWYQNMSMRTPKGIVEGRQLEVHGIHKESQQYGYNICASITVVAMWQQWEFALRTIIESIRFAPLADVSPSMKKFWLSHRPADMPKDETWPPRVKSKSPRDKTSRSRAAAAS